MSKSLANKITSETQVKLALLINKATMILLIILQLLVFSGVYFFNHEINLLLLLLPLIAILISVLLSKLLLPEEVDRVEIGELFSEGLLGWRIFFYETQTKKIFTILTLLFWVTLILFSINLLTLIS